MHEKKCPHCDNWTDGSVGECSFCGKRIYEQEEKELVERRENQPNFKLPLIKIHEDDGPLIVFGKLIIQFGQVIYFGTIAFIVWVATWAVG